MTHTLVFGVGFIFTSSHSSLRSWFEVGLGLGSSDHAKYALVHESWVVLVGGFFLVRCIIVYVSKTFWEDHGSSASLLSILV